MVTRDQKFSICHWDTFDNETFTIGGADTLEEAIAFVEERYGDRLRDSGADVVDIVDEYGRVVKHWRVG
jgi:hypothetical protein